MKKILLMVSTGIVLVLLYGCGSKTYNDENTLSSQKKERDIHSSQFTEQSSLNTTEDDSSSKVITENSVESKSSDSIVTLSEYNDSEIEYARVWLALGPNQDIDELDVLNIPTGTLINPYDKTSAVYPKDTIHLSGSRLVDGSVTYSSNGDGTITKYDVPHRWEQTPVVDLEKDEMKNLTQSLIDEGKIISIEPGDSEKIIKLIGIEFIH